MLQAVGLWFRHFARNTKGNVAVLFGLALIPIMIGVGGAVDYGRALLVRERMADAADAAALAIGSWSGLTEAELKVKAQQYFNANYPPSELGAAGAIDVKFVGDNINVTVSGSVPTTFMELANIPSIGVGATTTVTRRQRNIELALVLDTTGSMGSGGKMAAMQNAAKKMVQDMFHDKPTSDTVKISVVPFAAAVNVGTDMKSENWIDDSAKSDIATEDYDSNKVKTFDLYKDLQGNWDWSGCVRERDGDDYELTDTAPSTGTPASLFAPYFAPDEADDDHDEGYNYSNSYIEDGDCGTSNSSKRKAMRCQAYTGKYDKPKKDSYRASGPNWNCPPRAVTPLTDKLGPVVSAIEELQPSGNTVIPAGLLWGWRILSPTAPFTEGKAYDENERVKAIVLLTDGENSVSGGGNGKNKSVYNAFGYARNGHLGSKNGSNAEATLDSKTTTVCSRIKAKGILIYTIGFQVNSATQTLLKNCATKDDMFFNSPSNDQLASIFKDIAQGLGELRIAQ
ncbi:pilus assembly protein [Methyloceanibacter superfactus]|nr:pilus assembly protein [Methyloceanibacter superfactus]